MSVDGGSRCLECGEVSSTCDWPEAHGLCRECRATGSQAKAEAQERARLVRSQVVSALACVERAHETIAWVRGLADEYAALGELRVQFENVLRSDWYSKAEGMDES